MTKYKENDKVLLKNVPPNFGYYEIWYPISHNEYCAGHHTLEGKFRGEVNVKESDIIDLIQNCQEAISKEYRELKEAYIDLFAYIRSESVKNDSQ